MHAVTRLGSLTQHTARHPDTHGADPNEIPHQMEYGEEQRRRVLEPQQGSHPGDRALGRECAKQTDGHQCQRAPGASDRAEDPRGGQTGQSECGQDWMQHHERRGHDISEYAGRMLGYEIEPTVAETVLLPGIAHQTGPPVVRTPGLLTEHQPIPGTLQAVAHVVVQAITQFLVKDAGAHEGFGAVGRIPGADVVRPSLPDRVVAQPQVNT